MKNFLKIVRCHNVPTVSPPMVTSRVYHVHRICFLIRSKNKQVFSKWIQDTSSNKCKYACYISSVSCASASANASASIVRSSGSSTGIIGGEKPFVPFTKSHIKFKKNKKDETNYGGRSKNETSKKKAFYIQSKTFPYVSVLTLLSIIGVSAFFHLGIFNLRYLDTQENMLSEINKLVYYLDRYFIIYDFETNSKMKYNFNVIGDIDTGENSNLMGNSTDITNTNTNTTVTANSFCNFLFNSIFNRKYITSLFFTNENLAQCSIQLCTFFLASCFLEKYFGSVKYLAIFLIGGVLSSLLTCYFFHCIKKIDSLNDLDFILIHPTGPMAFVCAVCSLFFRNYIIWKNTSIYYSICIVPYLFSSFYGLLYFYRIISRLNETETSHSNAQSQSMSFDSNQKRNDTKEKETVKEMNWISQIEEKQERDLTQRKIDEDVVPNTSMRMVSDDGMDYKSFLNEAKGVSDTCGQNIEKEKNNGKTFTEDHVLNILKLFLIINACDSIIKKRKKEGKFPNKKILNLKRKAMEKLEEIKKKSNKIFFELSSTFTDIFGILSASATFVFLKLLRK